MYLGAFLTHKGEKYYINDVTSTVKIVLFFFII